MDSALSRLKNLTNKISSYELARKINIEILKTLFMELGINEKVALFEELFLFKAINLSGASLNNETLGAVQKGKYLQILAISYDKTATIKATNISLGYYGNAQKADAALKDKVVEFVIRYRFEKSFMTLEHYYDMLENLKPKDV